MTLAAVRAELVVKLKTVVARSTKFAPDAINPPAAFVGVQSFDPHDSFGGDGTESAAVWYVVSRVGGGERAADGLDTAVASLVTALEGSSSAWDSLNVSNVEFPITVDLGANQYLAARFDCEVFL